MDKKRRTKFQIAVYGIVGALGIILVLISLVFKWQDPWQAIWINLGTGLLGVGILFFLVDRFFLADEWGLSDRIDQLIRRLEVPDRPSAEAFFTEFPDLTEYVKTAMEIDLCGVTLTATITRNFFAFRERLLSGASMRLLIAEPDSHALETIALRSETPANVDLFAQRLASTFKDIENLFQISPDDLQDKRGRPARINLSVRLLPYAPSFYVLRCKAGNDDQKIVVAIYPNGGGYETLPVFILNPELDKRWYDYFAQQFEQMWNGAKEWTPTAVART